METAIKVSSHYIILVIAVVIMFLIAGEYNMEISTVKTKILTFKGKSPISAQALLNDKTNQTSLNILIPGI
jgi:hypothetical protein